MSPSKRILIAGAGLGGLAAAYRLAKDGHDVSVFERTECLSIAQGAIFIRSNAVRCFVRWGLEEPMEEITAAILNHQTRSGHDNALLLRESPRNFSESPEWTTTRAAVQEVLYNEAIRAGASISFGAEIVDISETEQEAHVAFKDGSVQRGDILLVADGISSRLRAKVLPGSEIIPIPAASTHYPAEIPKSSLIANELTKTLVEAPDSGDSLMWAGYGGYAIGKYNPRKEIFNIMYSIGLDKEDASGNPRLFDEVGDPKVVREFFKDYCPVTKALADMTVSCSRWRLARLDALSTWSSPGRRMVLLGDSAHAMLPNLAQGFSTITEDVDALSLVLETDQPIPELVALWEKIRLPRANRIQAASLWNYNLFTNGKAPGSELTEEERSRPAGEGDAMAPFNTASFNKWVLDYDCTREVSVSRLEYTDLRLRLTCQS